MDQSYSVQEIAELFGIHKNTILQWLKRGLPIIDKRKPYLIHGSELKQFLGKVQKDRKHKCLADEFYCFRCRLPRRAWENAVDIVFRNEKKLILKGLCVVCETTIQRIGSFQRLEEYQKIFLIQRLVDEHIVESTRTNLNSDLMDRGKSD